MMLGVSISMNGADNGERDEKGGGKKNGRIYLSPTPLPAPWTLFPALSTTMPAKEPAEAIPDWMVFEMGLSLAGIWGSSGDWWSCCCQHIALCVLDEEMP